MNVLEILSEDLIDMNLQAKTKDEAIHALSTMLYKKGNIRDLDKFIEVVYKREGIGETGMGNHIAIPHGLTQEVRQASVAIGKVNTPIVWESLDGQPVELIFLIAISSKDQKRTHLQMLSSLASILAYQEYVEGLKKCRTNTEFLQVFTFYFEEFISKKQQAR